jgi:signal transduction histidine kinase
VSGPAANDFGAERIGAFYAQAPGASRVNLSMGAIAGAVMWGASSRGLLLGWLALVVATNVFRLAAWHLRQRDPDRDRRWQFWARVCVAAMFGSGFTWGMGAALMISPESPILMAFWLILVTGIGAGLVAANAFHLPALWAYLFPLLLPVVARIAAQGGFEYLAIAAGLSFYLAFCVQQGRHQAHLVLESFRMRSENQSLVVQLQNETRAALVAKQSAEESERAKSRFFAAASHDLRQPLQAVSLYASSLSHAALPDGEMRLVRGIGESAAALTDLFDELLEIARLDARTIVCDPKQITLQQVFNRLELLFAPVAIDSATRLYIRPCGYSVLVDELLLTRLLGNLVGNGLKYAKGGTVVVLARKRPDELLIEVRDNGPGISQEQQALVFEEFYQADNPERDRHLGFGLGLPTAVRIADLIGARIGVRSRPGAGSVFWVRLPFGAAPPA